MQNTIQEHCYFVVQLPSFELVLINFNQSSILEKNLQNTR